MTRHDALAAILALTEEAHGACTRGEADAQTLTDLTGRRATLLCDCPRTGPLSDAERCAITRLQELDGLLMQWGEALQHDLERARARIVHREPGGEGARVLTDVA